MDVVLSKLIAMVVTGGSEKVFEKSLISQFINLIQALFTLSRINHKPPFLVGDSTVLPVTRTIHWNLQSFSHHSATMAT